MPTTPARRTGARRSPPTSPSQVAGVPLSNPDKVLYPAVGFTKAQVVAYYADVASFILPHLKGRPVTLKRYPDGVHRDHFYEKDAPGFTPTWVSTVDVPRRRGDEPPIRYILINDLRTLVWTANLASLELHPFLHRAPAIDTPTAIVFDLDPGEGADVLTCARVAFILKDVLARLQLQSFPKVSGSKGLQVYVPLNTAVTYEVTQPFARTVAELLEQEHRALVVARMAKSLRGGKVFIDWSQNADHKTTVAAYSLRATRDRPFVSLPVTWPELEAALTDKDADRLSYGPEAALKRLAKVGDLFAPVLKLRQRLSPEFMAQGPAAARAPTRTAARAPSGRSALPRRTTQGSQRRLAVTRNVPIASRRRSLEADLRALPHADVVDITFIEPMQCQLVARLPDGPGWQYEAKYDGYRALAVKAADRVQLLSRRGSDLRHRFPAIVEALRALPANTILDGEIVALDDAGRPRFNLLQRTDTPAGAIVYYAFDVLAYAGRSLRRLPLRDRRPLLEFVLADVGDPIRLSARLEASVDDLVAAAAEVGLEGIVAKRLDSMYEPGRRSGAWVKQRISPGQELVVGGYVPGTHGFDALLVGYYEGPRLRFVGKIRNGFVPAVRTQVSARFAGLETDTCPFANLPEPRNARRGKALTREAMRECRWLRPELVAQIEFTEWTEQGHLRHARFLGLRDDKDAREVTREAEPP